MEDINNRFGFRGFVDSRIGGRSENQDAYGYADTPLGLLVVVCDGMGGGPAGKTASELAKNTIVSVVRACKPNDNAERTLRKAVEAANSALLGAVSANPSLQGMGTTCVALLLNRKYAYIAHVGDSRCYILRDGKTAFRTSDHSYVAEMVRKGELTEEQARQSNHSNLITRAVGIRPTVEADIDRIGVKSGDRFALMTDGIWGTLPEVHLVSSLCSGEELPVTVTELADRVDAMGHNNGGNHDNMTLAMVEIPVADKQTAVKTSPKGIDTADGRDSTQSRTSYGRFWLWLLVCALVFSLAMNAYMALRTDDGNGSQGHREPGHPNLQQVIDSLNRTIDSLNDENSTLRDSLFRAARLKSSLLSKIGNSHEGKDDENERNGDVPKTEKNNGGYRFDGKRQLLQNAIDILSQLDTMGQKGNQKPAVLKRKKKDKQRTAAAQLSMAAKLCQDRREQQTVSQLGEAIAKDAKIVGADTKGRPTMDAKNTIREYISQIKEFNR